MIRVEIAENAILTVRNKFAFIFTESENENQRLPTAEKKALEQELAIWVSIVLARACQFSAEAVLA